MILFFLSFTFNLNWLLIITTGPSCIAVKKSIGPGLTLLLSFCNYSPATHYLKYAIVSFINMDASCMT